VKVSFVCSLFGVTPSIAKRHLVSVGCKMVKTENSNKKSKIDDLEFTLIAPITIPVMTLRGKRR
jgi:hypothetical protein